MERSKLPAAGSDDFIFKFMNNFPQSCAQGENLMHGVSLFVFFLLTFFLSYWPFIRSHCKSFDVGFSVGANSLVQ